MIQVPSRSALRKLAGSLAPDSTLREAAKVLTSLQAMEIDAHVPAAVCRGDEGALHDVRVASRRLRAGVSLFRELYPLRWTVVEDRAREVTRGLRAARDLDVRILALRRMRAGGELSPDCRVLARTLLFSAVRERKTMLGRGWTVPFLGKRMAEFLPELWRPRIASMPALEKTLTGRLRESAREALFLIPSSAVERHAGVQHRLRIKCKSLRYSLEMLEWRMGKEATWRIAVLRKAQDVLGDIHDTDVFLEFISSLERLPPAARKKPCRELTASLREERKRHFAAFLGLRAELERAATLHNF